MYTITAAESSTSAQIWSALVALRQLDAAADAVASAGALTANLVVESGWRNDGLSPRALRVALSELHTSMVGALSDVRRMQSMVERGIGA